MEPFLRQVARHYSTEGNISGRCFIFPNRRSQVFFQKHLGEAVKEAGAPIIAPKMLTINDFFYKISGVKATDRVNLLLRLYDCYKELYKGAEPLDEFIFWGDVILGDFDDVDKYLVEPEQLFTNIADFKGIQDTYSYLTDTQRKAIEHFVEHFRKGGKLTVEIDSENPNVKGKFLRIWNILFPLYTNFRKSLKSVGMAYEGMVYRDLADRLTKGLDGGPTESATDILSEAFKGTESFVFVGLNALNECERTVMRKMRDAQIAEFCWDYSSSMIRDPRNKSSFFMSRNVEDFPQSFKLDQEGLEVPEIEVISVPSSVGQAKLVPSIVKNEEYAIVIPDETLLIPLLNSIPPSIKDINVTMGYPMKSSAFFDFLSLVSSMQMHLRQKDGKWYFYHNQVWAIFSSSIFRKIVDGDEAAVEKIKAVKKASEYYIPQEELSGLSVFDLLFRPVVTDPKSTAKDQISAIADYQKSVIKGLAEHLAKTPDLAMELEFAKAAYKAVNLLKAKDLEILPMTYFRLLDQLLGPVSIPFNGEPLKGLQIMGPLETRALDFRHIVILSCNEGIFPHHSVSSSFIPPELRKGFGLPTYEFQDAVWAYYFYRMIQRAETVTLVYDSRTEGIRNGEESRYIKQLEYHFNLPVRRSFVKSEAKLHVDNTEIVKTEEDVEKLKDIKFSASTLKNYLDCPAKFYFTKIAGLRKEDEVAEEMDTGMIGRVYHSTIQALYMGERAMDPSYPVDDRKANAVFKDPLKVITKEYIDSWLKRKKDVKERVRSLILKELRAPEVVGRNLVVENVIVQYVLKTLQKDRALMDKYGVDSFEIVGLEKKYEMDFDGYRFEGYVDRLDSFLPGQVRVVDYKTGSVGTKDVDINDSNAADTAETLFAPDVDKRPKIAFQMSLYDILVGRSPDGLGKMLVNSVYQPANFFVGDVVDVPMCKTFNDLVEEKLHDTMKEIASTDVGWRRTGNTKICSWCDFKMICGR